MPASVSTWSRSGIAMHLMALAIDRTGNRSAGGQFPSQFLRLVFLCLACVLPTSPIAAQSPSAVSPVYKLEETALALAPADAAFFVTSVNLDAAWQDFVQGPLMTRLRSVGYIQRVEAELRQQWDDQAGPMAQVRGTLENPNVRNIIQLLRDMGGQEWFVYGGDDWCDMIEGLTDFQTQMFNSMRQDPEQLMAFLEGLQKSDIDKIRIPTTVLGFRLSDDENARLQLDALEGIVRVAAGQVEEFKPFLKKLARSDLSDGQTLTWTFDNSLIPLDQLNGEELRTAERISELLDGRSVSISLGVKANIFLLAFGEGETVIDSVGQTPSKLLDHKRMDVLREADLQALRSVAFASERWRESQWKANFKSYFRNLSAQFSMAIKDEDLEIPDVEQWQADIDRDAAQLDELLAEAAPDFGDLLSWSSATEGGLEGWMYDWNENKLLVNASPLDVLQHAGAKSLMLIALKMQDLPVTEEMLDVLLEQAPDHLRRFVAAAEDDDEDRKKALRAIDLAWPLAEQAFEILRDKISPSMASNETLISFSAAWTASDIGPVHSDQPLPLPELAIACGLVDKQLFLEGCEEIYGLFDELVNVVQEIEPEAVPAGYSVPRPKEENIAGASVYSYTELTEAVPVRGFKPALAVADNVVILGFSERQVADMLDAKPLRTRPAWMNDQTPVAAVNYIDFAGMFNAARPWLKFGFSQSGMPLDEPLAPGGPFPAPTANDLLQIWDCFTAIGKAAGTSTVNDSGPTVSQWVWISQ